ncbi:hypothetical protein [Desulfuromonas acetoxidans]|uniref:DnaK suppressor protein (Partial length)-like n=1 Tax=Desulfuromonas acetoxidans (strain DSM 684 / 11070) TaxID=281689 RepID=Q1JX76_DESA6|nr:hypothetical protein [Desulfuromonas acetoxidans]EAT14916.1 DnaK suppressor protein (partial length)-like [Desulfuromonas acetoxidans DSM 684]MBF0645573.1 hypothetical protein [Desulfuromonas acetoxidans]NVD23375.1 hypothetical protein [Desulfuromonas acetoxidans]NVE15384.1 hypothetical protein [Desulfuromonas acetoxidans]
MNKSQRQRIKRRIEAQLTCFERQARQGQLSRGDLLRSFRLRSALARVDSESFGRCLRCEQPLNFDLLQNHPERMICGECLNRS